MSENGAVAAATLAGSAGGARTFVPPAALVIAGRGPKGPARYAILAAALGEMAMDKTAGVPGRVQPQGIIGRMIASGATGHALAGRRGAAAAATAAAVTTLGTWRARAEVSDAVSAPDPAIAAAEDVFALTVAGLAVRSAPHQGEADGQAGEAQEVDSSVLGTLKDIGRGLAAAAVGTAAMTGAQVLWYRVSGEEQSEAPANVVRQILAEAGIKVPRKRRKQLNWATHIGYGLSWGIPLGLVASRKPDPVKTGLAFGGAVWSSSLIELPSLDQSPPIWDMELKHVVLDAGFHLIYGLTSGAALAALKR